MLGAGRRVVNSTPGPMMRNHEAPGINIHHELTIILVYVLSIDVADFTRWCSMFRAYSSRSLE